MSGVETHKHNAAVKKNSTIGLKRVIVALLLNLARCAACFAHRTAALTAISTTREPPEVLCSIIRAQFTLRSSTFWHISWLGCCLLVACVSVFRLQTW